MNKDAAKHFFIRRIGNMQTAEKEYFDVCHREFSADEYIETALDDCCGYFGTDNIPNAVTASVVADIAYVRYKLDTVQSQRAYGVKSISYSEGTVSQSETYATEQELSTSIENILKPYSRFRVVSGHGKAENTA